MAGLTHRQQIFIEIYLTCWNATEAARQARYAHPNTDGPRLLVNASIAATIKARIADKAMTADEVLSRLADHGRGTMEDFLTLRTVRVASTVTKPVADVIRDLRAQVAFEEKYAARAGLAGKDLEAHESQIASVKRRILRLELRLEDDPGATEDVPGPMTDQQIPDIDLAKAADRGKLHLVKSYNAKDGKIELYDAHASLVDIGKHHSLFKDVVEIQIPWDDLTPEQLQRIRDGEDPRKVLGRDR